MKFLVDAQLPSRLKFWLTAKGFDCSHTLDLARGNKTKDSDIAAVADNEARILVSKDSDFLSMKILKGTPQRLLLVTTGNIDNATLVNIFESNFQVIEHLFQSFEIVEIGNAFVAGKNVN